MRRKPLRQVISDNLQALDFYAAISGKETPAGYEPMTQHKKKSVYSESRPKQQLESEVIKSIAAYLAKHPKVKFAVRQNSGAARMYDDNRPLWFYRWAARKGREMRITDFWGMTTDNRMFAIECKRPGWKKPSDQREYEQANFIETVGLGCFATCIEDVARMFENVKF